MSRLLIFAGVVGLTFGLTACGFEAPAPGQLLVFSEPPGAEIIIDGNRTGNTTPFVFRDLEGGTRYTVGVASEGWTTFPAQRSVLIPYGGRVEAAFTLNEAVGALTVTSEPAGAEIFLDGEQTGEFTPHTFESLIPGQYIVTVALADHLSQPDTVAVIVEEGGTATAAFELILINVPRIVLLEGFSNVFCIGCPTMNRNVKHVLSQEGYGPQRVLFVKWPAQLSNLDPFYWTTRDITNARVNWYFGSAGINLPSLTGNGQLLGVLGTPYNAAGIMNFIDSQPVHADVQVTVTTDEDLGEIEDTTHQATMALLSPAGTDLTGHQLHVVLVYETVDTEHTGYQEGITEYHWVMRDHVLVSSDIGPLAAGQAYGYSVDLTDPPRAVIPGHEIDPRNKQIIAWIQHAASKSVIQAGSTVTEKAMPVLTSPGKKAPIFPPPAISSGGHR